MTQRLLKRLLNLFHAKQAEPDHFWIFEEYERMLKSSLR